MAFSYPRKQTVIVAVICILVVLVVAGYAYQPVSTHSNNIETVATTSYTTVVDSADTNWQKSFFSVASTTAFQTTGSSAAKSASTEPLTNTDIFGRESFSTILQLRQSGLESNSQAIDNAATELTSGALARLPSPTIYAAADIKIISRDDEPAFVHMPQLFRRHYKIARPHRMKSILPTMHSILMT